MLLLKMLSYFNSIKVQLRRKPYKRVPLRDNEFQFHKGTIKTGGDADVLRGQG